MFEIRDQQVCTKHSDQSALCKISTDLSIHVRSVAPSVSKMVKTFLIASVNKKHQ